MVLATPQEEVAATQVTVRTAAMAKAVQVAAVQVRPPVVLTVAMEHHAGLFFIIRRLKI
ncbi:MAG: hypothetical protein IJQ66_02750 [Clostridia bacterium]|nr:hypothetical protein [Clostridia bacterium]